MLLVLLYWLNGAEWKLTEEERQVLATGTDGRLDVEPAVAAKNLQELHKTCREGLSVEVVVSAASVHPHRVAITVTVMPRVPVAEPESSGPGISRKRVSQKMAIFRSCGKGLQGHQPVPGPPKERDPLLLPQLRDRGKTACSHFMWYPNG